MSAQTPDEHGELLLFPRPRRLQRTGGHARLERSVSLGAPAADDTSGGGSPGLAWLSSALLERGHYLEHGAVAGGGFSLLIERREAAALDATLGGPSREGYVLSIAEGSIRVTHATDAGRDYALATLTQLVTLAAEAPGRLTLPCLVIEDFPDFPERGVMLDVSRDKVPTLETLFALIDQLARWKINRLQLYMEHTFAYAGHEVVWKGASPLTAAEVRELDAWCAARHVELVPNQNSFGHMHRWLVHEPYRALAECPDGFDHPWNWTKEPYGLCATDPGSLRLLEGLYDQLLPNFRSRQLNVGLDETIDLGACRSRAVCEARGTERVYLDFLKEVHARVQARGRVMQFWGDIIIKRPDLMAELPRDAVALEWGYEADHPFAEHLALFAQAGLAFQVCPGTSSWNSIAGRTENALLNIARAAREGKAAGAAGLLVTDWGDHGHLQPLPVSYLGLFAAAGFSWNVADAERPLELDLPCLLDRHVFRDSASALGRVAYDLGNVYREAGSLRPNASVLFWILIKPERLSSPPGVTRATLEQTLEAIERAGDGLPRARPVVAAEGARVVAELGWARDVLRFSCRLGLARLGLSQGTGLHALPATERGVLRNELTPLIEQHRALWLRRNRVGGLDDSARRLENIAEALRG